MAPIRINQRDVADDCYLSQHILRCISFAQPAVDDRDRENGLLGRHMLDKHHKRASETLD